MIRVEQLRIPSVEENYVEIVERKGIGHPDTICDAIAEQLSINLSRYYLDNFGRILHHNLDKAVLVGGASKPKFGGGEMVEPIEIKVVGRAVLSYDGKSVPLEEIYLETARSWLEENLPNIDTNDPKHIKLELRVRGGSYDLVSLFEASRSIPEANDTSFGVGFAPLSRLEKLVMEVENTLNSKEFKDKHPFVGEDIKVMGLRLDRKVRLTLAVAFVDRYVSSKQDYLDKKHYLVKEVESIAKEIYDGELEVFVNTADIPEDDSLYITVTGTSAESGDDGQVGRGNRMNGLITPYRPMSLEAPAGKNPVNHVGKLYNILANRIANEVVESVDEVEEAYVYIVSQIGKPINQPQVLDIRVRTKVPINVVHVRIDEIARKHLESVHELWKEVLSGNVRVY